MAKIGVMDSGCGGLSVLRELLRVLPEEQYVYFSDNAHCPDGEKSREFIIGRCRDIVDAFLAEGVQAVVIACNTATAAAIATLRAEYPRIPFVGMEPAVKPAVGGTRSGTIGVLATNSTLHSAKYIETRDRYAQGVRVVEHVGEGFVELVESLDLNSENTRTVVERSLRPLLEQGADNIVLGCTHYPFLVPVMQEIAGSDVRFIDPAPAAARQLSRVLDAYGMSTGEGPGSVELKSSGPVDSVRRLYESLREV